MALFRRRGKGPVVEDPDLPLDVDQAARLRALVRQVFAEHGREVVVHSDHLADDQGVRFGLWNVAAVCADKPRREWPAIVRRHVHGLLDPDDLESVAESELLGTTYLRLIEAAQMPRADWHPTATVIGESVLLVLAVDRPAQVTTPRESFWEARGGVEHWRKVGRANLRDLLAVEDLKHQRLTPPGGTGGFDVVMGDSFFAGSLALLLDEVRDRYQPGLRAPYGVLVAVPFRHQFAWSVVEPGEPARQALENLFGFAAAGFSDAPGPISPHVYWVHEGRWRQLTRVDPDGLGSIDLDEEAARALGLLP